MHDRVVKKETIINAFRTTGIWPFNGDSVHYERCLGANKPKPIADSDEIEDIVVDQTIDTVDEIIE